MALKLPKEWSKHQRRAFRGVKNSMLADQSLFMHPKADAIPAKHWKTIAHNAAWFAAEFAKKVS